MRQLKLLDIIGDLQDEDDGNKDRLKAFEAENLRSLYIPLSRICEDLKKRAVKNRVVYQGGLGHPMNEYELSSGLIVTVKNSENGAWYGEPCNCCIHFPCHDALMALRLTTDSKLQFCLLNGDISISISKLTKREINGVLKNFLAVYKNARFISQSRVEEKE